MINPDSSKSDTGQDWRQRARQIIIAKKYHLLVSLMLLLFFLGGIWYGSRPGSQPGSAGSRRILHYVDPMNPAHTSPEPGLAPCGMKMEPVYADGEEGELPPPFLLPGAVKITPQKQQLIGVRLGVVEKAPYTHTLRALARVALDETRIYRLNSYVDGWIKQIFNNSTGSLVLKDEVLVSYYSRETLEEVNSYLAALAQMDRTPKAEGEARLDFATVEFQRRLRETGDALKNLGMSKVQLRELAQTRRATQEIYLAAPVTSFVLSRNVSPGQKISKGDDLYKLADLSRVWIVADLYENEAPFIKPGLKVRATLPHQGQTFWATVTDILPDFDKVSRTLKVRLEADNPDYTLRPDIFVDVEFPVNLPETVSVPVDALMDTGLKKTVFVDRGQGYFEPRRVETGWRLGDRVEITKGLKPGERIVISGNFLVDSESRMKLAAAGFVGEVARDPVTGINLDESRAKAAGLQSRYKNQTYYFHSEESRRQFEQNPERYLEKQAQSQEAGSAAASETPSPPLAACPVCGLEVDKTQAKAKGLTSEYQGKTYYFCRYHCNREFDKDPGRYLKAKAAVCAPGEHEQEKALIVKDPVCGLDINRDQATAQRLKREYQGQSYYFCRDYCAQQFDKAPDRYALCLAPSQTPLSGPPAAVTPTSGAGPGEPTKLPEASKGTPTAGVDPVCGMKLMGDPNANPHKTYYKGRLYYFCTDRCKEVFDLDPERHLQQQSVTTAVPPAPLQGHPEAVQPPGSKPVTPAPPHDQSPPGQKESAPKAADPGVPEGEAIDPGPAEPVDPVCGRMGHGDSRPLSFKSEYQGKTYYFCSEWCKKEFDKKPQNYVTPPETPASPQKEVKPPSPTQEKAPPKQKTPQKQKAKKTPPPVSPGAQPAPPGHGEKLHD